VSSSSSLNQIFNNERQQNENNANTQKKMTFLQGFASQSDAAAIPAYCEPGRNLGAAEGAAQRYCFRRIPALDNIALQLGVNIVLPVAINSRALAPGRHVIRPKKRSGAFRALDF
jgi:hypothetical protein